VHRSARVLRRILWCGGAPFVFAAFGGIAQESLEAVRIRAQIERIERSLREVPDRPAALFLLASGYARLGDGQRAIALLKETVDSGEGFDPRDVDAFQPLQSEPQFRALVARARRLDPPVHTARVAFTVAETDLFPEGLAFDPGRRVFYMGSMHHKKIVMITEGGVVSDFVKPDVYGLSPVGGVKVDPTDHSLWAATDGPEFVHIDAHGNLLDRFATEDPGPHILNDLVLRGTNEIYLTDTTGHQVYRFDRERHTFAPLIFQRPLFYPNGITLSADGDLLFVADAVGVIRVDLRTGAARDVDRGRANTLAAVDGLYWYRGDLIGVQNTGSYRVIRWGLSAGGERVTFSKVLERGTPLVSDPTTGAIVGDTFYFIANTGISNLEDDRIVDPTKLEPVRIASVRLNRR
jgi:hypothetical protein